MAVVAHCWVSVSDYLLSQMGPFQKCSRSSPHSPFTPLPSAWSPGGDSRGPSVLHVIAKNSRNLLNEMVINVLPVVTKLIIYFLPSAVEGHFSYPR